MANDVVNCGNQGLPVSIDINVSVTKEQTVSITDLTTTAFVISTGPLPFGAGRIRYYSTETALNADFASTTPAGKAGGAFFDQNPRAKTFAVGQTFDTPQAAFLTTGAVGTLAAFQAVTDGSFEINIDGDVQDITAMNFSAATDLDDVAAVIEAALQLIGTGGYTASTVSTVVNGSVTQFVITSGTTGDLSTITTLATIVTGTDVSGLGFINGAAGTGVVVNGYAPTGLTNELNLIKEAATCSGEFVYAWALDGTAYRDNALALEAAAWAETQQFAQMWLVTNDPLTFDPDSTTDTAYLLKQFGYTKTSIQYHDDANQYPDTALSAVMLAVDYAGASTITNAKFRNLAGITTVGVDETQLSVIENKRCNVFTLMSDKARTVRPGIQVSENWYIDTRIGTDNFVNELLTNVYNVFTTNNTVPYTSKGLGLIRHAESQVCERYVRNGFLATLKTTDTSVANGVKTVPPYALVFAPLSQVTPGQRAAREYDGNQIFLQLASAINTLTINVFIQD